MTNVELTQLRRRPEDGGPTNGANGGNLNNAYDNAEESGVAGGKSSPASVVQIDDVHCEEDEDEPPNGFIRGVQALQDGGSRLWAAEKKLFIRIFLLLLLALYTAYFIWAMIVGRLRDEGSIRLCWVTCVVLVLVVISYIVKIDAVNDVIGNVRRNVAPHEEKISWFLATVLFVSAFIYVLIDVFFIAKKPSNLMSGLGLIVYILVMFIFSYNPAKVKWRIVVWGIGLQLLFALLILKTSWGYAAFEWLGTRITEFLTHVDAGSKFLFGEKYTDHFFAFKVLPIIVFFSTVISMLYYLGVMQVIIHKVAWVMQVAMGTTAGESLNAAGNIFIGQTEAPLMIRPLIQDMTCSEIHSVMTSGFATIAGSVLGAYILFGVPANHLLSASVMSAPAALAVSKLFYPETKKSKTTAEDVKDMEKSPQRNIIEAASYGASQSIKLVANIAVNLIAFLALLAFVDATLSWFGDRVGVENFNFEFICSYLFYPLAFLMGVESGNCRQLGTLIGVKTFLNEFVAYDHLSKLIKNKVVLTEHVSLNGTFDYVGQDIVLQQYNGTTTDKILSNGVLTARTEVIATYALCGFANFGSIGVMLGGLGVMAPHRKADMAKIVLRAMIAGNVACFMTACIAGLLYNEVD